jgi:glycosyltransferase involved in cell wall biosynthesis
MRIALVAPFGLRVKGTTRARVLPLGRKLARRGHEVALFIPPYDSPQDSGRRWTEVVVGEMPGTSGEPFATHDSDLIRLGSLSNRRSKCLASKVDVINISLPRFGQGSAAWHLWLAWRLFRAVAAWQPDVVHVFKPKGPSGLAGTVLWLMRSSPCHPSTSLRAEALKAEGSGQALVTLSPCHLVSLSTCLLVTDADDWEGPGGWNDDPRAGYTPLQRRFFAWQERFGLSHADAWTVASECLRERAIEFGAAPKRVFVLPNGVSEAILQIANSKLQESAFAICNLQSAILYTRFAGVRAADVVAIWARVRERIPQAVLTVVGRGLAGEERELIGQPGIEVLGWVEPEDLPVAFAKTALAVIPWRDMPANRARSSVKVRELMAAGLPIVAYAVGELPATLGDAGMLVLAGDAVAFADAVVSLMADPERVHSLGMAAQARVQAEFSWKRLAEIALRAYAAGGEGG